MSATAVAVPDALASHYVDAAALDWTPTRFPGISSKVLMRDDERGLMTALFKFEPGAVLPDHVHEDIEQTFMLEGSLQDQEGTARAGEFVWRPAGSRHDAWSPDGGIALSVFLRPNRFIGETDGGGTA